MLPTGSDRTFVNMILLGAGCHPSDPVAEGGPVGDGGNRRDWFPRGAGDEGGVLRSA